MAKQSSGPYPYPRDWHNNHYDERQVWLVSPWPDSAKTAPGPRIANLAVRLGGMIRRLSPGRLPKRVVARP